MCKQREVISLVTQTRQCRLQRLRLRPSEACTDYLDAGRRSARRWSPRAGHVPPSAMSRHCLRKMNCVRPRPKLGIWNLIGSGGQTPGNMVLDFQ